MELLYLMTATFIILGLLLTPILPVIFADYIDFRMAWDNQPMVCANDFPFETYNQTAFVMGVMDWKWKLNEYTDSEGFPITYRHTIDGKYTNGCNVNINFYPYLEKNGEVLNIYADALCTKYDSIGMQCEIRINMLEFSPEMNAEITMKHEMGHVLGLSHRQPLHDENPTAIIIDNDIMFFQAGPYQNITLVNLKALYTAYGNDGWAGENREWFKHIVEYE